MYKTLLIISACIGLTIAIVKFLEVWIGDNEKHKLQSKLEDLWIQIDDSSPKNIAIFPLGILDTFYNAILGNEIFSKKAYFRSSIISTLVLLSLLLISGMYTGHLLSIETPPWKLWDELSHYALDKNTANKNFLVKEEMTEIEKEKVKEKYKLYGSAKWKFGHAILFTFSTILLNAFFDATSLSMTRLMLREALISKSILVLICILFTNLIIALLLSTLAILLVMIFYMPISYVLVYVLFDLLIAHPAWTIIGVFALMVGTWTLSGLWLKIVGLTTVLPIVLLCFTILFYFILYPMRFRLHALSSNFLLNAVNHEKGVIAFCIVLLGVIGSIVGCIGIIFK